MRVIPLCFIPDIICSRIGSCGDRCGICFGGFGFGAKSVLHGAAGGCSCFHKLLCRTGVCQFFCFRILCDNSSGLFDRHVTACLFLAVRVTLDIDGSRSFQNSLRIDGQCFSCISADLSGAVFVGIQLHSISLRPANVPLHLFVRGIVGYYGSLKGDFIPNGDCLRGGRIQGYIGDRNDRIRNSDTYLHGGRRARYRHNRIACSCDSYPACGCVKITGFREMPPGACREGHGLHRGTCSHFLLQITAAALGICAASQSNGSCQRERI